MFNNNKQNIFSFFHCYKKHLKREDDAKKKVYTVLYTFWFISSSCAVGSVSKNVIDQLHSGMKIWSSAVAAAVAVASQRSNLTLYRRISMAPSLLTNSDNRIRRFPMNQKPIETAFLQPLYLGTSFSELCSCSKIILLLYIFL